MLFSSYGAFAAPVAATCDPDEFDKMKAQGEMQAQQDVETMQNLVTKPDSVLEYTCFDQYVSIAAEEGGEIFSDADLTTDTGGLFGDDFFNALLEGVLSDVLSQILPKEFFQIMDILSGLQAASVLLEMTPQEREQLLRELSAAEQDELRDHILAELPPDARDRVIKGAATLEEVLNELDALPPEQRDEAVPPMNNDELENFLSMLPPDALDALMDGLQMSVGGGHDDKKLDRALESVVLSSLKSYTDANFDHSFLGGRVDVDYEPTGKVGQGKYNCDRMNAVWQMAKCQNFQAIPDQDGFKTLADYASGSDPRQLPQACQKSQIWQASYDAANAPAKKIPVYTKELDGEDCSKAKIVKLDQKIVLPDGSTQDQYVCSNAACEPKGGACVKK